VSRTPECRVFLVGAASCQARARKHSLDQGQDIHGVVISELLGNEVSAFMRARVGKRPAP